MPMLSLFSLKRRKKMQSVDRLDQRFPGESVDVVKIVIIIITIIIMMMMIMMKRMVLVMITATPTVTTTKQ